MHSLKFRPSWNLFINPIPRFLLKLKRLCIEKCEHLQSKFVLLTALLLEDRAKEPLSEQKVPKT